MQTMTNMKSYFFHHILHPIYLPQRKFVPRMGTTALPAFSKGLTN